MASGASLRPPPPHQTPVDGSCGVLLEHHAYIAPRRNATTASASTRCGKEIQVTLCLADPPRVSYVCVHCPTADFSSVPEVIAMERDLLLLRLMLAPASEACHDAWHYFIYRAEKGQAPSLELLPHIDADRFCILCRNEVVLLRTSTNTGGGGGGGYIIASIKALFSAAWKFKLCLFDSTKGNWTSKRLPVDPQIRQSRDFLWPCSKVLAIGGQAGTIAWVNFGHGIFLCDVLAKKPILRYIPLPPLLPLLPGASPIVASQIQDIAVVHGRIKFVDMLVRIKPGPTHRAYNADGWVAATWSREVTAAAAAASSSSSWQEGHTLSARDINPLHLNSLPKLKGNDGTPLTTLETYHVGHPTVSLHDGDTVYFMAKVDIWVDDAWVLSVDMKNGKVQGVAEFTTPRTFGMITSYSHSRISEFLDMDPDTKGNLKRPGMLLPECSHKKLPRIPTKDAAVEEATAGAERGDTMEFE